MEYTRSFEHLKGIANATEYSKEEHNISQEWVTYKNMADTSTFTLINLSHTQPRGGSRNELTRPELSSMKSEMVTSKSMNKNTPETYSTILMRYFTDVLTNKRDISSTRKTVKETREDATRIQTDVYTFSTTVNPNVKSTDITNAEPIKNAFFSVNNSDTAMSYKTAPYHYTSGIPKVTSEVFENDSPSVLGATAFYNKSPQQEIVTEELSVRDKVTSSESIEDEEWKDNSFTQVLYTRDIGGAGRKTPKSGVKHVSNSVPRTTASNGNDHGTEARTLWTNANSPVTTLKAEKSPTYTGNHKVL